MKRVVLVVLSLTGFFIMSCSSVNLNYSQPAFDKPNSYVIDSQSTPGKLKDRVRLINQTSEANISFMIYMHEPSMNVWVNYGTARLTGTGDTAYISSNLSGKLSNYRYFAIESLQDTVYNYNYSKRSNDLHITILNRN